MNKRAITTIIISIVIAIVVGYTIGLWSEAKDSSSNSVSLTKIEHKAPVNIKGVYVFDDFDKKDCWANCKITVEVSDNGEHMSVISSDDYDSYPMWYGSVDGQSIADKGKWASKRTENSDEVSKLDNSPIGIKDSYYKFNYEDGNVVFDIQTMAGKTWHIVAKPMV